MDNKAEILSELEIRLLSELQTSGIHAARVFKIVAVYDFTNGARGKVYARMRALYIQSGSIDSGALYAQCSKDPALSHVLAMMMKRDPDSGNNIIEIAERIAAMSRDRYAIQSGRAVAEDVQRGNISTGEASGRFHKIAADLEARESAAALHGDTDALSSELDAAKAGQRRPVYWPWKTLSELSRSLGPGKVTLFCGSPGASKSLMLNQALIEWSSIGVEAASLCLEDGAAYHLRRALAQLSGIAEITNDVWCENNPDRLDAVHAEHKPALDKLAGSLFELPRDEVPKAESVLAWLEARCREKRRVIAIDPFTLIDFGQYPWIAERNFVNIAKGLIRMAGASLICVTHPRKTIGGAKPASVSMDDMAGSAALSRFSHCLLWLGIHGPQDFTVDRQVARETVIANRTMAIMKCRDGIGSGEKIAMAFNRETLCTYELGRIVADAY